jgi:hypothetical protein
VVSIGLGCLFAVRRFARYLDGQRPAAWAFMVSRELYLALRPGLRVHVQMNERRNRPIQVEVTEPPDTAG